MVSAADNTCVQAQWHFHIHTSPSGMSTGSWDTSAQNWWLSGETAQVGRPHSLIKAEVWVAGHPKRGTFGPLAHTQSHFYAGGMLAWLGKSGTLRTAPSQAEQ